MVDRRNRGLEDPGANCAPGGGGTRRDRGGSDPRKRRAPRCGHRVCHRSGGSTNRPCLDALLAHVREGDEVAVALMDRLARSVPDLLALVDGLTGRGGVTVRFLKEGQTFELGSASSMSRFPLGVLGAVAEFERSLIREWQADGIAQTEAKVSIEAQAAASLRSGGGGPPAGGRRRSALASGPRSGGESQPYERRDEAARALCHPVRSGLKVGAPGGGHKAWPGRPAASVVIQVEPQIVRARHRDVIQPNFVSEALAQSENHGS
ncbi:recombinase family protein [Micrococcus luteus]|uniref:recombinase family protein n=1 Tax=Micrococcus luteus TaxID=1270 RepID=UPI0037FEBB21